MKLSKVGRTAAVTGAIAISLAGAAAASTMTQQHSPSHPSVDEVDDSPIDAHDHEVIEVTSADDGESEAPLQVTQEVVDESTPDVVTSDDTDEVDDDADEADEADDDDAEEADDHESDDDDDDSADEADDSGDHHADGHDSDDSDSSDDD